MADKMTAVYQYPLSWSFLKGFLPNFKYGWLSSNSRLSLNTGFVQWRITKMADKMTAVYQYLLSWSFLIRFLPNFTYGWLPSNFPSSLNTGFVRRTIIKMADKMDAAYLYLLSWSLYLSRFNCISSKFHIWMAFIKLSLKFEYRFCQTNDSQDGRQNGRRL